MNPTMYPASSQSSQGPQRKAGFSLQGRLLLFKMRMLLGVRKRNYDPLVPCVCLSVCLSREPTAVQPQGEGPLAQLGLPPKPFSFRCLR